MACPKGIPQLDQLHPTGDDAGTLFPGYLTFSISPQLRHLPGEDLWDKVFPSSR